jgi:hypothetical protein
MSSTNTISTAALLILRDALLANAARIEREKQIGERLSVAYGTPVELDADFTFELQNQDEPIGVGNQ